MHETIDVFIDACNANNYEILTNKNLVLDKDLYIYIVDKKRVSTPVVCIEKCNFIGDMNTIVIDGDYSDVPFYFQDCLFENLNIVIKRTTRKAITVQDCEFNNVNFSIVFDDMRGSEIHFSSCKINNCRFLVSEKLDMSTIDNRDWFPYSFDLVSTKIRNCDFFTISNKLSIFDSIVESKLENSNILLFSIGPGCHSSVFDSIEFSEIANCNFSVFLRTDDYSKECPIMFLSRQNTIKDCNFNIVFRANRSTTVTSLISQCINSILNNINLNYEVMVDDLSGKNNSLVFQKCTQSICSDLNINSKISVPVNSVCVISRSSIGCTFIGVNTKIENQKNNISRYYLLSKFLSKTYGENTSFAITETKYKRGTRKTLLKLTGLNSLRSFFKNARIEFNRNEEKKVFELGFCGSEEFKNLQA